MKNCGRQNVTGVIVPVITPIDESEHIDEKAFRMVIRRCLDAGVDGIFAGGSSGMGPLLLDSQWQLAMEVAKDEVGDRFVLMGGIITESTARAIERIRILERIGYERMVVTPTFYITLNYEDEMLCHFGSCRDATDMEMVLYNIPSCTGSSIPLKAVEKMVRRGWSRLYKESSGDGHYFSEALRICTDLGANVLQGDERGIESSLLAGAAGIVPVCANYEPGTFITAFRAAKQGDRELLNRAQQRILAIREVLLMGRKNWISGIMYGVSTLGIGRGIPMRPLQLSEDDKHAIDKLQVIDIS